MKSKVLFVCVHNSARSQMAEAFLNKLCPDDFLAESAGLEPGEMNPLVVEVMNEIGIDLTGKLPQSSFELFRQGRLFSYVVTVCDEANGERCPIFPGLVKRLHWGFPDPAKVEGTHEEKLEAVRSIRDAIRSRIESWCSKMCSQPV